VGTVAEKPEMRTLKSFCLLFALATLGTAHAQQPRTLDWMDLVPDEDRLAWETVPEQLELLNADLLAAGIDEITDEVKLPDVLYSTAVRSELEGQYVRLPGFIVPLEYNERNEATGFFLVPYFGACIHLPPPPPNQIVYVSFPDGAPGGEDLMFEPYWVSGTMRIDTTENELGVSTYSLDARHLTLYEED
jgi:uncharacterized protein